MEAIEGPHLPVGTVSSARYPGQYGTVPVGYETNALDVMGDTGAATGAATGGYARNAAEGYAGKGPAPAPRPRAELRNYKPSPSEKRRYWLEQNLGRRNGRKINWLLDWVDPVTPLLDFEHRRDLDLPVGWEDAFDLASVFPGAGKLAGKGAKGTKKALEKATGIKMGRRTPPHKRTTSKHEEFANEIANVLKTGEPSKNKLFRSDLGEINIHFGEPGDAANKFKGGWGLSHVGDKRTAEFAAGKITVPGDEFMQNMLPRILSKGKLHRINQRRDAAVLTYTYKGTDYKAILKRNLNDKPETWLLTGMERYSTNVPDKWGRW